MIIQKEKEKNEVGRNDTDSQQLSLEKHTQTIFKTVPETFYFKFKTY